MLQNGETLTFLPVLAPGCWLPVFIQAQFKVLVLTFKHRHSLVLHLFESVLLPLHLLRAKGDYLLLISAFPLSRQPSPEPSSSP